MFTIFWFIALVLGAFGQSHGSVSTKVITKVLKANAMDIDLPPFTNIGDKLYYFSEIKASWFQAFLNCRSMGGHLASFDNQQDYIALTTHLLEKYPIDRWWWLSATDNAVEGEFFWYNTGNAMEFTDWANGQPDNDNGNENCVHLTYRTAKKIYQMNDRECNSQAYYICEATPINILLWACYMIHQIKII